MLDWWLNLRWAAQMHRDTLAKIDVATVLIGAAVAGVLTLVG